ncbi:MAG: FkbM family methyltransferase [Roseivirga sp.]|nr:FkbM family methyltransferase [Roseivirga sp.]
MSFIKKLIKKGLRGKGAYRLIQYLGLYRIKSVRRAVILPGPIQIKNRKVRIQQGIRQGFNDYHYLGLENQADAFTLDVVMKLSGQASSLWDIGAFIALDSLLAAETNPNLEIVAFEPNPGNFMLMEKNLELNGPLSANIKAFPYGIGPGNGHFDFYFDEKRPMSGSLKPVDGFKKHIVDVYAGDFLIADMGLKKPDLIKIDVEGYEGEVLSGFTNLLKELPTLIVEVLTREGGKKVEEALPSGYEYFGIIEETRRLLKKDELTRLSKVSKNYLIIDQSRTSDVLNSLQGLSAPTSGREQIQAL